MILLLLILLVGSQGVSVSLTQPPCTNQFYNSVSYSCVNCGTNQALLNNRCQCSAGYYATQFVQCQSQCYCHSDDGSWANCSGSCTCNGHAITLANGLCQLCPNNLTSSGNQCSCASGTQSDNYCVTTSDSLYATIIAKSLGPKAQEGCGTYNDMVSCQQLTNLCVLSLSTGTFTASSICALVTTQSSMSSMPILKFTQTGTELIENQPLKMQINFKENRSDSLYNVPLYVIEHYLDGSVSQLKPLANQLQLCSGSYGEAQRSSLFGVDYRNECDVDLSTYANTLFYKTKFFQLYLKDIDGTYYPIPVYSVDSSKVGSEFDPTQYSTYEFISRFFIVDNQQSTTELYYASDVQMIYYLSTKESDKTFIPYLYIQYNKYTIANAAMVSVRYQDRYFQSDTNFYSIAGGLLIGVHILVVIMWVIRLMVWSKRNPPYTAEQTWIISFFIKAFYCILDTWSEAIFYYLFFMTGYWFCFFKFQQTVYVLMPSRDDYDNNYKPFEILFFTMFAARLITLLNLIWHQTEMEVFFIDWEKSEVRRPVDLERELGADVQQIIARYETKKSAWRTLLVANEFNELQVYRIVSVEWTLLFVGFFLIGLKWQNLSSQQPNLDLDSSNSSNYVLQYFLCNFIYLAVGLAQIIIQKLFDIWFPIQVEDFVDLCSIANVSLMILDDALHGYYIHGENPIGVAEGSSEHLAQCLYYETMGKGKKRGLTQEGEDTELQTYEMFVPMRFRIAYDTVFKMALRQSTDRAQYGGYGEIQLLRNPLPTNLDMKEVELKRNVIQYYIKDVLSQIRNNYSKVIRDKLPMQRFLSYPPSDLEYPEFKNQSVPVFFRDPDQSFKKVFFCGHEFFFLITDTMIFNFWMILSNNAYLSIMLTYLITIGVFNYRAWLGERNLSDQSKIDQRFLI